MSNLSAKQSVELVERPGDADEMSLRNPATVRKICEATFDGPLPGAELFVAHHRDFLKHHEKNGVEGLL